MSPDEELWNGDELLDGILEAELPPPELVEGAPALVEYTGPCLEHDDLQAAGAETFAPVHTTEAFSKERTGLTVSGRWVSLLLTAVILLVGYHLRFGWQWTGVQEAASLQSSEVNTRFDVPVSSLGEGAASDPLDVKKSSRDMAARGSVVRENAQRIKVVEIAASVVDPLNDTNPRPSSEGLAGTKSFGLGKHGAFPAEALVESGLRELDNLTTYGDSSAAAFNAGDLGQQPAASVSVPAKGSTKSGNRSYSQASMDTDS